MDSPRGHAVLLKGLCQIDPTHTRRLVLITIPRLNVILVAQTVP